MQTNTGTSNNFNVIIDVCFDDDFCMMSVSSTNFTHFEQDRLRDQPLISIIPSQWCEHVISSQINRYHRKNCWDKGTLPAKKHQEM